MEIIAWILVVVLGLAVAVLLFRKPENPYAAAVDRLTRDMEREGDIPSKVAGEPAEVAALRERIATRWEPVASGQEEDPGQRALEGLVRFLREAALRPLAAGVAGERRLEDAVTQVLDALGDLEFYAQVPEVEEPSRQNLLTLVQEVVREYIRDTDIPVKVKASSPTLPAQVPPSAFKDALFLVLANAGRFGGGQTVVVEAEGGGGEVEVRVIDRGPGFSQEAVEHAFDPFWSSDPDAVGLGLTHARRLLRAAGIQLRVGNREEGGGEAVLIVSTPS